MEKEMITPLDRVGMESAFAKRFREVNGIYVPVNNFSGKPIVSIQSFEDLLKRDEKREEDGFPRKIKIRRIIAGKGKIIVVPYVEEAKLIHGEFEPKSGRDGDKSEDGELGQAVGAGEGDVGDVIGQVPLHGEGEGEGEDPKPGQDEGEHGIEAEAYKVGKELSEKFKLPNLKDKGKKVPTDEYTYDLTDRHVGSGQLLDKKATLKSIIKTNIALGRLDKDNIDTTKFVIGPKDKVYRVLSREKVWKSQAIAIFLRDYSGSMVGEPTKAVVTQHLIIYAWLMVQYEKMVIPRFFVHDTEAKEVTAEDYFRLNASGGTFIASGYKEITKTVEGEALARDYNIYVFQGTDGDDGDDGREAIPEIEKILGYVNRMGVSVLKLPYYGDRESTFEHYMKESGIPDGRKDVFRMHVMSSEGVTEEQNIEAIKELIAQN